MSLEQSNKPLNGLVPTLALVATLTLSGLGLAFHSGQLSNRVMQVEVRVDSLERRNDALLVRIELLVEKLAETNQRLAAIEATLRGAR